MQFYSADRTLERLFTFVRGTWTTSDNHLTRQHTYNPRGINAPDGVYGTQNISARTFTRMKYGPVFVLGVVGGNSSSNSTWDHFRIYGMLDRKVYGQKNLSCCLLYREKDRKVTVQSDTMSQRWHAIPTPMWGFHVSCSNEKHEQGKHRPDFDSFSKHKTNKCTPLH